MAEKEEEKGFVIKDRRMFSSEEQGEKETPETAGEKRKTEEAPRGEQAEESGGTGRIFPEVSFSTFVISLSSSALLHLGEIPDPSTNETLLDLEVAKQIIDTLGMLQDKTKGNLDNDEERLLKSILYDLRMRYVQKTGGK